MSEPAESLSIPPAKHGPANALTGEVAFTRGAREWMADPPLRAENLRQYSRDDAGYRLDLRLTTLTASWYAAGRRTLLVWGAGAVVPKFHSDPDLERFLDAVMRQPRDRFRDLRGCWGLVLTDGATNRVILAVDRAAQRPICYSASANGVRFSLSALDVSRARGDPRIRPQAIFDYLRGHVIAAPDTLFEGVSRLLPGEFVDIRGDVVSRDFYWEPSYDPPAGGVPSPPEARDELLKLLTEAVARKAGSGRTGAFLSGGLDSSTVAGMLGKVTGEPARTYSIGFDAPGFDEMEYARIAARHFKTDHHEYYVTPDDLVRSIPEVAAAFDQPFGNSSALPAYYCARLAASDGIERMLGGDGGDEIFGGNTRYAKQKVFDAYRHVPAVLDRTLIEALFVRPTLAARLPIIRKLHRYVVQARVPLPDRLHTYNLMDRLGLRDVLADALLNQVDTSAPATAEASWYARCHHPDITNRLLQFDWKYTLADNDLPKVTGACDLAGIPVGFPLLDEQFVAFANHLPGSWKVAGTQLRPFYRSSLRDFLPQQVIAKAKHGFGLPFGWWLIEHAGLQAQARGSMEAFRSRGLVCSEFIDDLLDVRLNEHAGYFGEFVWTLMILELWLEAYAPSFKFD